MVDKERYTDRYERMSPQELNAELRKIYSQISNHNKSPQYDTNIPSNRNFSFAQWELNRRHAVFINRSHLTPLFKVFIIHYFGDQPKFGTPLEGRGDPPRLKFTNNDLLDSIHPEGGGIFDPTRAKEIERMAYRLKLSQDDFYTESRDQRDQIDDPSDRFELESIGFMRGLWLNAFLKKHGELP